MKQFSKMSSGELRELHYQLKDEADAIIQTAEKEDRGFSSDENKKLDEVEKILKAIERETRSRELPSFRGKKGNNRGTGNGNFLAQTVQYLKTGKGPDEVRAITSTTGSAAINDPVIVDDILFSLLPDNSLVKAGAQFVNVQSNQQHPKITAYPTAQWVAEGSQVSASDPTIGSVKFDLYDLAILVRVQNQVLYDSSERAQTMIQEAIRRSANDAILKAALYGASGSNQPNGLDNISGVQTTSQGSAVFSDYSKLVTAARLLMDANVPLENVSFMANPVIWEQFAGFADTTNQPLLMPKGVMDMPQFYTTAVKTDYGVGNDETVVYMGDFSQLVIGVGGSFEITLSEKYSDYLQTGFLIHTRVDVQALQPDNFVIIEDVATA